MYTLVAVIGLAVTGQVAGGAAGALNTGGAPQQPSTAMQVPLDQPAGGGLLSLEGEAPVEPLQGGPLPNDSTSSETGDLYGAGATPPTNGGLPPSASVDSVSPGSSPPASFGQSDQDQSAAELGSQADRSEPPALKPSVLMAEMLVPPPDTKLTGVPATLSAVVERAASREGKSRCVEAYWDLCSAVTDYYLGLREQQELKDLRTTVPRIGAMLQLVEQEVAGRTETARHAGVAAQYRLASLIGGGAAGLPLPQDVPHCGNYHCYYDEIFATRPSPEAQSLASLLPQRHAELKAVAAAIERDRRWVDQIVGAAQEDPDGSGAAVALELLALRRRAFVQLARDYNRRIARYCELAAPGEIASAQLVGMLIRRNPGSATQHTFAAEQPAAAGAATGSAILDNQVERAAAEVPAGPVRERSLLVTPP